MMATIRHRQQFITQLIRATRGKRQLPPPAGDNSTAAAPPPTKLPCFPLQQHHFGQLAGAARFDHVKTDNSRCPDVATPSDFHSYLCRKIQCARERVVLASLYIGVGSNATHQACSKPIDSATDGRDCKEDEFLQALHSAASNKKLKKMQVLLDANRALRNVSVTNKNRQSHGSPDSINSDFIQTNSAEAVFSRIKPSLGSYPTNQSNGVFLFPVNDQRLCSILPSPLDEVAGVFHIKAYIVDDELILSGANLSEEYFSNRLDRYMHFTNSGGGLVDFYANLCDILCDYAIRYDGPSPNNKASNISSLFSLRDEEDKKEKLELSLMHLFDGKNQTNKSEDADKGNIVAYAIPTFQMPTSFLGRQFRFQSDTEATRNLLRSALKSEQSASVRLSSAYLNLTPKLLSVLTMYGKKNNVGAPYILTAGAMSHGFAPKPGGGTRRRTVGIVDKIKATIPEAFLTLVKETAQSIIACGGKIILYERPGWTFHAKGIWITTGNDDDDDTAYRSFDCRHTERINNPSSLLATIIGSGNYGARSEDLDVESNCILIFNDSNDGKEAEKGRTGKGCTVKESVAAEWNSMCESSSELREVSVGDDSGKVMRFVLEFMKRYL